MSVAEKITSIETHIGNAYQGLANLGADLTNVDKNIDNIASQLDTIYSNLPKVTGEGTNISLSPTLKGKLELEYKGDTIQEGTPTPDTPVPIQVVTGTQTVTISNADNTESQTYTIHLGEEELCKIGNYQDKIYYDNGKWYKYSEIGKKLGTELSVDNLVPVTQGIYLLGIGAIASPKCACYCNGLTYKGTIDSAWNEKNGIYIGQLFSGYSNIYINKDYTNTQKAEALAWLRSFNFTLYYVLANASTTEITNETLLSDLNNIKEKAMSYSGTTNISISGDLPIVISASALKGE